MGLGNATYELVQPTAWDEIIVSAEALEAVAKAGASHDGATPLLPQELIQEFRANLKAGEP
jgi:hypothetical protein